MTHPMRIKEDHRIETIARKTAREELRGHGVESGVRIVTGAGGGVTDHGDLTGLGDDDHPQYLLTSGGRQLTGPWDVGAVRLRNLQDPALAQDAATKAYVDANTGGAGSPSFSSTMITEWNNRASYSASGTAFAWKGQRFTPFRAIELHGIGWMGAVVAGATYQAAVTTESGGLIATITKSSTVTLPGTLAGTDRVETWLPFATPVTLNSGTLYYLMVGRTDSTDTYALPISSTSSTAVPSIAMPGFGGTNAGQYPRIAKANPVVGDAIDLSQNAVPAMGWMYRLP
jgi:hypothetical protein